MPAEKFAAFRLRRHHLRDKKPADPVTICRDLCGVQAQVMSAAYLQLWTRNHALRREHIEDALWKKKSLVKASLMRQTLHLIPSEEFAVYIAALRVSRIAGVLNVMRRFKISDEEAAGSSQHIMHALAAGPMKNADIRAAVHPKVSPRMREYMRLVSCVVRLPLAEGWVCYGPGEANEVRFIRTDQWLEKGKLEIMEEAPAQQALLKKFLRAYGPATAADFAHWAGIPMKRAKDVCASLLSDLHEVKVDDESRWLVQGDERELKRPATEGGRIDLLPLFDPYLLAHAKKDHLIEPKHYKRVYRNQGWISAVILLDGKVIGTWEYKLRGKKVEVKVSPFEKLSRPARAQIAREATALADFFGRKVELID